MNSIIDGVMAAFGITQQPLTVSEFLWDVLILIVGLYIVKWVMVTIFSLMKYLMKF